jgi:hypothetical protein
MDVDRHVEGCGALEDRAEFLVVHEAAVGEPHDHGAFEAELAHRAFQFVGGGLRVGRRQRGKAGETAGMRAHRLVQHVVGGTGELDGGFRVEVLRRRIVFGDHLEIDAGVVRGPDAQHAEVVKLALQRRVFLAAQLAQFRRSEMFLETNDLGLGHDVGFFSGGPGAGPSNHPTYIET